MSAMDDTIPTNLGYLTPPEIIDWLMYSSYAAQRDYGLTSERLVPFFDVETFEPIYRARNRMVPLTDDELGRVGGG